MSRIIKFRGLRADGKGWVYGVPVFINREEYIKEDSINVACIVTGVNWDGSLGFMSPNNSCFVDVKPESVGQYTGENDIDVLRVSTDAEYIGGDDIYEGDRCVIDPIYVGDPLCGREGVVVFKDGAFLVDLGDIKVSIYSDERTLRIVGNIHE